LTLASRSPLSPPRAKGEISTDTDADRKTETQLSQLTKEPSCEGCSVLKGDIQRRAAASVADAGATCGSDEVVGEGSQARDDVGVLLPPPAATGRSRRWPMREVMNALFYVLRGGCPWRMLPEYFPPHQTACGWLVRFRDSGLW
jgi:hypothetical protein